VDEDGVVCDVVTTPIGTAVFELLAHANGCGPELAHIRVATRCEVSDGCPLKI
jgi:hypothetical protein